MPGKRKPGPSVKDDDTYEALRREGAGKEKAARIANASADEGSTKVSKRDGAVGSHDDWTTAELRRRASELDVEGRSSMTKSQLVKALRDR